MTAKQTLLSASLVIAVPPLAHGEPEARPPGEVPPTNPPPPKREPTGSFEVGAGYSTDDGFGVRARVAQSSLFGTGKQLSLTASLDQRRESFVISYVDPAVLGTQLRLQGDLFARRWEHPGFTREGVGARLALSRRIAPGVELFAGYRVEEVEVEHDTAASARGIAGELPWRGGTVAAVRAGLRYSSVDQPEYARRGTSAGAMIEIADRALGSDLAYTRTDAWLGHHRPLGPLTLHLSGRVRTITDVPLSERLHFDGSSDVRGFAPGAVGSADPVTGLPTGGNFAWSARAELEAPLVPRADLSIAGFVDAGGLHGRDGGEDVLSAGVGLVWRSPIGPLRFDLAFPLTGEDRGPRYIFGIGGIF